MSALGRRELLTEVGVVFLCTLLAIRLIVQVFSGIFWDIGLALIPILFMYVPVWVLRWRGEDPDTYPLAIPALSDGAAWWAGARLALAAVAIVSVPWVVGYHAYQTVFLPWIAGLGCDSGINLACVVAAMDYHPEWRFPSQPGMLIGYHLFFVAIPEEMFYRGYMQTRLDLVWKPRWSIFGAKLGWGWLVTCVVFAFGHSLVQFQWWHFAIFFPSLVFGWMRARTDSIVPGSFFHAASNVGVAYLDTIYGILPP